MTKQKQKEKDLLLMMSLTIKVLQDTLEMEKKRCEILARDRDALEKELIETRRLLSHYRKYEIDVEEVKSPFNSLVSWLKH